MKCLLALVAIVVIAPTLQSAEFVDDKYGYTISSPELGESPAGQSVERVSMKGPVQDGFTPNINVQIQKLQTTRDEFIALSEKQMAELKWTVRSKKLLEVDGAPAVLFEADWKIQGLDLRFLQLAIVRDKDVMLTTCTTLVAAFPLQEAEFSRVLASVKLKK